MIMCVVYGVADGDFNGMLIYLKEMVEMFEMFTFHVDSLRTPLKWI